MVPAVAVAVAKRVAWHQVECGPNYDGPSFYLIKKKKGERTASRRYNLLPLLPSGPDGV